MAQEHTPGPWEVHYTAKSSLFEGADGAWREIKSGEMVVGEIYERSSFDGDDPTDSTPEEAEANAHLIAAAPDMKAALLSAFDADMNFNPAAVANFCGLARAALSKARGAA